MNIKNNTGRLNHPDPPFLEPGEPRSTYKYMKHKFCRAILLNIFHKLPVDLGCPRGNITNKETWKRAIQALIVYEYLTPNGKFLTEKGFLYVKQHAWEWENDN